MKVRVKHKAGKKSPSIWIRLRVWHFVIWSRIIAWFKGIDPDIETEQIFSHRSKHLNVRDTENDWLKSIGTKSGWITKNNHEEILAFRNIPYNSATFEKCLYINKPDVGKDAKREYKDKQRGSHFIQRMTLKHFWPVAPHAGGTYPPDTDFEYILKAKRLY